MSENKWGAKKETPMVLADPGLLDDEFMAADPNTLVDRFIVKWTARVHPYTKYKRNIALSGRDEAFWMKNVKNMYRRFVVEEEWPEAKFVMVIDDILSTSQDLFPEGIIKAGVLYDQGRLALQLRDNKGRKRL